MNSWSRFGEDEVDIMVEEIKSLRLDRDRLEWLVYRGVLPIKTKDGWRINGDGSNPAIDWRDAIDQGIAEKLKTKGEMNMSEQQNEVSGLYPLTLEQALEALASAIEQCEEYSENEHVLPKNCEGFEIAEMRRRITETLARLGDR